ncbi:MAG TPA: hypothetical protein VNG69_01230 [Casimicrobiaceae bacterium]|nr:hypothetical protein [Casimicrobiaceae bacterium]
MSLSLRRFAPLIACVSISLAPPVFAQPLKASYLAKPMVVGGNPGPVHNYVCPNVDGGPALDCFLDAIRHLYTMCKHVKTIEIIEFGYEKSDEGTNTAKSESCVDKQKLNIAKPYAVALKEAPGKPAIDSLRNLYDFWLTSLVSLKWRPGESDEDYGVRTGMVYPSIDERVDSIRTLVAEARATQSARVQKARR